MTTTIAPTNIGTIYLLHFDRPFKHARHYLGWTRDLDARLEAHANGTGANLMRHVTNEGIGFVLARTWEGDRNLERQFKSNGHARRCPLCLKEAG